MSALTVEQVSADSVVLRSLALEITGRCQNRCPLHCYAKSGPAGSHGTMTRDDWYRVLDEGAALGVRQVQYIGGEPTLHPHLPRLVDRALGLGMRVEVFSNLVHVRPSLWHVFERAGVNLATSYYSDDPAEHEQITGGRGSYARTRANIAEAIRRGIPLRASLVHVLEGQRTEQARAELRRLGGVGDLRADRVRRIGNGDRAPAKTTDHDPGQLCGRCGRDRAAVLPDGRVALCVMSRFLSVGSIHLAGLPDLVDSPEWRAALARVPARDGAMCRPRDGCEPAMPDCGPKQSPFPATPVTACKPDQDGEDCAPAEQEACKPSF
ncbi:radical SAM/SPASM domain-containing protein [Streptomyces boncukensis]|uniref:Radical SAM/SPASM domain-containing protein n=1 Tax=Streptomyces boncukensis TaxID=2711219 RepID=A0A6G4X819_9ACTN|nr:radical SAM/SPASM domain-containing protein [Streptomyces boncukensis]NGO72811.1 radical SAM/SPASM domain-containing protein [Streptomyces boncukensis]